MKGQYFIHVSPDAVNPDIRQVRRGQIVGAVGHGQEFWLVKFQGKGYTWNAVMPTAALQDFALFDTISASEAWFAEAFPQTKPVELPPEKPVIGRPEDQPQATGSGEAGPIAGHIEAND